MPRKVLIALAGKDLPIAARQAWGAKADIFMAADAGADRLAEAGLPVDVLIGDLDSASEDSRRTAAEAIRIGEQDHTDYEKALFYVEAHYAADEILAICCEGDLFDHVLANALASSRSSLAPSLAIRSGLALIVPDGGALVVRLGPGKRVSLLPLSPCVATLAGVKWPFADRSIGVADGWSVSNQSEGVVTAKVLGGNAILIVEVVPGTWPSEILE